MPYEDVDQRPAVRALARNRVKKILAEHTAATLRTLEAKIAEAGPPHQRVKPRAVSKAVKALMGFGDILVVGAPASELCEYPGAREVPAKVFALSDAPQTVVTEKVSQISQALTAFNWATQCHPTYGPGKLAEHIVRNAITDVVSLRVGAEWGDVVEYGGLALPHAADGVIHSESGTR